MADSFYCDSVRNRGLKGTFPIIVEYIQVLPPQHIHTLDLYAIILHVGPLNYPQTALTFIFAV